MAAFSKSRLERMRQVLSGYVEREEFSGLVSLISHGDVVHADWEAQGMVGGVKAHYDCIQEKRRLAAA